MTAAPDSLWWHRVFAALPRGFSVTEFTIGSVRAPGDPQLRLIADGQAVGVYGWRLEQIAMRHTQVVLAADALARAVRRGVRSARAELLQHPELRWCPGVLRATAAGVWIAPEVPSP